MPINGTIYLGGSNNLLWFVNALTALNYVSILQGVDSNGNNIKGEFGGSLNGQLVIKNADNNSTVATISGNATMKVNLILL